MLTQLIELYKRVIVKGEAKNVCCTRRCTCFLNRTRDYSKDDI